MTTINKSAGSYSTEEAWRIVSERAAAPPIPPKVWSLPTTTAADPCPCPVAAVVPSSANVSQFYPPAGSIAVTEASSKALNPPQLPLKKRRRVFLSEYISSTNSQSEEEMGASSTPATSTATATATATAESTRNPDKDLAFNCSSSEKTQLDSKTQAPNNNNNNNKPTNANNEEETIRTAKFPHLLPFYQTIYNQDGHVGIYNSQQRAAKLHRFHQKRLARKWKKKIRYDCRKNLADKRVRVKGRFVKGGSSSGLFIREETTGEEGVDVSCLFDDRAEVTTESSEEQQAVEARSPSPVAAGQQQQQQQQSGVEELTKSVNANYASPGIPSMLDTTDVEAGFDPKEDSPFRRTRRVTVP